MRTKDTYYFPHDYEPTSDPKIQALIGEYGAAGYGVYWRIVEMLHSDQTHKLPFKQYIFLAIAKQMLANAEQIQAIISYCIDTCELFHNDSEFFWSDRVINNIEERNKLSEIRAVAGRAGAIAKQTLAKGSKGKERKEEEIKEKEIKEDKKNGIDYNILIENYHALCPKMSKVEVLNQTRKGYINARVSEFGIEKVIAVIRKAGESDFLNGKNDKAWRADFEWILRPENFVKVMEGKYDNKLQPEKKRVDGYYD